MQRQEHAGGCSENTPSTESKHNLIFCFNLVSRLMYAHTLAPSLPLPPRLFLSVSPHPLYLFGTFALADARACTDTLPTLRRRRRYNHYHTKEKKNKILPTLSYRYARGRTHTLEDGKK